MELSAKFPNWWYLKNKRDILIPVFVKYLQVQVYWHSTPLPSVRGFMKWDMRKYLTKYPTLTLIKSIFETLTFSFLSWFRIFNELNLKELFSDKKELSGPFSKSVISNSKIVSTVKSKQPSNGLLLIMI